MKHLFACLILLVLLCNNMSVSAQDWRISVNAGLAGFPEKNRAAGLQFGFEAERAVPLATSLKLLFSGGVTRASYTNTAQFISTKIVDDFQGEGPLCDCIWTNDRFVFNRTIVYVGTGLSLQQGRFSLSPGIQLRYDVRGKLTQHKYYPSPAETALYQSTTNTLWKLEEVRYDRFFERQKLSRQFNPAATLTFGYKLKSWLTLRLQIQQTTGVNRVSETQYVRQNTIARQLEPRFTREGPDATMRSLLLGLTVHL